MASKERLYELWMLYYTKVSAEQYLPMTPVVGAGYLTHVLHILQQYEH